MHRIKLKSGKEGRERQLKLQESNPFVRLMPNGTLASDSDFLKVQIKAGMYSWLP